MAMNIPMSEIPILRSSPGGIRRAFRAWRHSLLLPWIGLDAFRVVQTTERAHSLLVTTPSRFYKIGRNPRNTIALEYDQYRLVAASCGELTPHLPAVHYAVRCGRPVLQMNRIPFSAGDEWTGRHAHAALELLKRKGRPGTPADWRTFPFLQAGTLLARSILDPPRQAKLDRIMQKASARPCRIGPVYGDFHHENLLSVGPEQFYLIDPTGFMPTGIQSYDALHFIAYRAWKTSGKGWSFWMDGVDDCQTSRWQIPGCESIARDFIDVDLDVAGVFYATCRLGQLSVLLGDKWTMPERQRAGWAALVDRHPENG